MARKYTMTRRPTFSRPLYMSGLRIMAANLPAQSATGALFGVPSTRRARMLTAVLRGADSSVGTVEDACWFQGAVLALQGSEPPLDAADSSAVMEGYRDGSGLLAPGVPVILKRTLGERLAV